MLKIIDNLSVRYCVRFVSSMGKTDELVGPVIPVPNLNGLHCTTIMKAFLTFLLADLSPGVSILRRFPTLALLLPLPPPLLPSPPLLLPLLPRPLLLVRRLGRGRRGGGLLHRPQRDCLLVRRRSAICRRGRQEPLPPCQHLFAVGLGEQLQSCLQLYGKSLSLLLSTFTSNSVSHDIRRSGER